VYRTGFKGLRAYIVWPGTGVNTVSARQTLCGVNLNFPVTVTCGSVSGVGILGTDVSNGICVGTSNIFYPSNLSLGDNYKWTVTGTNLTILLGSNTIRIIWNNAGNYTIKA